MDHGIPLNIHARPRIVGRRPNAIVNIETDVFQEKSYKQYSSQHLRDALIAVKKDFAISNVQCHYDSGSETEPYGEAREEPSEDHTYGRQAFEPPAFFIRQSEQSNPLQMLSNLDLRPKIMTIGPGFPAVNVIQVGDQPPPTTVISQAPSEYTLNKRIRRSEVVLRQAADCVSRGLTFQTVSEQFNIPISTIRFFMARKGILPRRRRGRTTQAPAAVSPEPPFHMQHYKLPAIAGFNQETEDSSHEQHT